MPVSILTLSAPGSRLVEADFTPRPTLSLGMRLSSGATFSSAATLKSGSVFAIESELDLDSRSSGVWPRVNQPTPPPIVPVRRTVARIGGRDAGASVAGEGDRGLPDDA